MHMQMEGGNSNILASTSSDLMKITLLKYKITVLTEDINSPFFISILILFISVLFEMFTRLYYCDNLKQPQNIQIYLQIC